ncbi:MAG: hypothetical protein LBK44_04560 [Spirochaetales bacterium]|jgi:hypothetical protein|nr:hypothetical protein [Spirochaetales bacterium]
MQILRAFRYNPWRERQRRGRDFAFGKIACVTTAPSASRGARPKTSAVRRRCAAGWKQITELPFGNSVRLPRSRISRGRRAKILLLTYFNFRDLAVKFLFRLLFV